MSLEYAKHQERFSKIFEGLAFLPPVKKQAKLLELGCGVGALTRLVAAQNPEARVIAIDSNQALLELAKNKAIEQKLKNINFVKDDVSALNPLPNEYDGAYCRFLLEDLQDPIKTLQVMKNSVKEGGWVGVFERLNSFCRVFPHSESIETMWNLVYDHYQMAYGAHPRIAERLPDHFRALGFQALKTQAFSKTLSLQSHGDTFTWYVEAAIKIFEQLRAPLTQKNLRSEQLLNQALKDYKSLLTNSDAFFLEVALSVVGRV